MTAHLRRQGYEVNHKRVQRLMRKMGLQAIYPKPRASITAKGHKVYPYLLRNLAITRPNQVWSADITHIPMLRGSMYLVAVMDWYSRYVVSWQLSNTLYVQVPQLEKGLHEYFELCNYERPHQSLSYQTSAEVHSVDVNCPTTS
jgi:transposase InsO family protein